MSADEFGELDETRIFEALNDHDVEFVLVGGSAAILWGAQRATRDVDCVAERSTDNLQRLCDALRQMGNPRLRIGGVDDATAGELSTQLLHPDFFERTAVSTWRTDAGSIDILSEIPTTKGESVGYEVLRSRATFTPTGQLSIPVASLDDIIESKRAADRDKDRDALPELERLRRQRDENA